MPLCSDSRPRAATSPWFREMLAACVTCVLMVVWAGASSTVRAQADAGAQANQLHAAIANGDVESLKYWLSTRHANPAAANAAEPGVTPIERCLGLAARVLDAGSAAERRPGNTADAPVVSLRVLQDMVTLLGEHGARITDADRERFSGPVIRWYDDAVPARTPPPLGKIDTASPQPSQPPSSQPGADPSVATKPSATSPPASEPTTVSPVSIETHPVVITTNSHEPCNGGGHTVYLVNHTQLSVVAKVTTHEEGATAADRGQKSGSYTVDPDSPWRLGCDASKDGGRVRYVLDGWR